MAAVDDRPAGARRRGRGERLRSLAVVTLLGSLALPPPGPAAETPYSAAGVRKFRREQPRPIELGTSGGNANAVFPDEDPGFVTCTSGTLGGLVLKDGIQYIISNNHVIALENAAEEGDPVDQPGLVDNRCRQDESNVVGVLSGWKKIKFGGEKNNRSDVAIAEVVPGMVDPEGRILRIGIPGDAILDPEIGMPVKKVGRTTGLTRGTITAINVSFLVSFSAAGSGAQQEALFVRQLVVEPLASGEPFVDGGDSGAVVVYDGKTCPPWVGLLFAGGDDGSAAVNPIERVLRDVKRIKPRADVTPVGCAGSETLAREAAAVTAQPDKIERALRRARRVQREHERRLLTVDGVVGVGLGLSSPRADRAVIKVFVSDARPEILDQVPSQIDGVPIEVVVSGPFRAL